MPEETPHGQYEQWVRSHGGELFALAYRLTGQRDRAEDLLQETFYEAWRSRAALTDVTRARAWLFSILRHRWAHQVRDRGRRVPLDGPPLGERDVAVHHQPIEQLADREALQTALDTLDDDVRVCFLMVYHEGLTCQQAAAELHIPLGTVLSRTYRARQQMRAKLSGAPDGASIPRRGAATGKVT
jgi:RNA polymerase sigma-70 factor (ECF subfamily)